MDTHNRSPTRLMQSVSIATKRDTLLQTAGQRAGERNVNAQRGGRAMERARGNPPRLPMWHLMNPMVPG